MSTIRLLSLFSGIGAFEKGLVNLKYDYPSLNVELVNYCEIDEHASRCYSTMYEVDESKNLIDICKVRTDTLKNIDLVTHGSPCQDFSAAGLQKGGERNSGTRSSLLWETVRIVKDIRPKYIIWENVKNVLNGKHRNIFESYLSTLQDLGYNNYVPKKKNEYSTLNSMDFGIPQNRERVFVVSIRKDLDNLQFKFPTKEPLTKTVEDFINFREQDNITNNFYQRFKKVKHDITYDEFINYIDNLPIVGRKIPVKKMGLYNFAEMDAITMTSSVTGTITCRNSQNYNKKFWKNKNIYKPSPRMCWRLMGFEDKDYDKCKDFSTDRQLYDRAGNSIVVNVAKRLLESLFKNQYII